jgi:hypothetical protein
MPGVGTIHTICFWVNSGPHLFKLAGQFLPAWLTCLIESLALVPPLNVITLLLPRPLSRLAKRKFKADVLNWPQNQKYLAIQPARRVDAICGCSR